MRVSIVQNRETAGDVAGQKGSATDTSLSRVTHAAVPASGGRRLNTPERRCVSTGGSTVSVAEPFCPTTSRNWEEATSLIGVKQHQKVVLVWREGVGCIAAQVPKVVSGEERGI